MSLERSNLDYHTPPRAQTVGMMIFLVSLFMLFTSCMLGYIYIRITNAHPGPHRPAVAEHTITLPHILWISTTFMLAVSVCFHFAIKAVRRERQATLRRWLVLAVICTIGFIGIQTPVLIHLLGEHFHYVQQKIGLYGLIFVLILVHAAHVLGGLIGLAIVVRHGFAGRYDHEHHYGLSAAAMYWHFLDAVWIVMFAVFLILG